ncbi:MAG: hypothetical protein KJI71_03370, partial [Patescibacteria group bacterium]|nr:hypothetical protein [Patescibacteria group bacterium]
TINTDASGKLTCGTGVVSGTGTDNYIPRWNGTDTLEDSVIYQTDNGNVGIGTTTPGATLEVEGTGKITGDFTLSNGTETSPSIVLSTNTSGNYSIYNSFGTIMFENGLGTVQVQLGQDGKLTVPTIDPQYEIDGKIYATYVPDYSGGVRTETAGKTKLNNELIFIIDFDELETGSDLWLFAETTDFGENMENLILLLTPEGSQANLWYELFPSENLVVIHGDKQTSFSFKFSAPREDWQKHPNLIK